MTTAKTAPAKALAPKAGAPKAGLAATDGYWTIQIMNRERNDQGPRFVCHAHDDEQARSMAGHLAGSGRDVVGYDYHRINNPHGRYARALGIGESERIVDTETWSVLQAARRSA